MSDECEVFGRLMPGRMAFEEGREVLMRWFV
jgi:hypothetical protein